MKSAAFLLLVLAAPAVADQTDGALANLKDGKQFPGGSIGAVKAVTQLMRDWSMRIQTQGKTELASYDKYACWCEDTLARKARDIANAKETIDSLQRQIEKLSGEIGSHSAEIENLKKLIADNKQEQQDATDTRNNENSQFEEEKTEGEQCIGALEAAIRVLSGAGEGSKKGFLQTSEGQAQILSVAGQLKVVLRKAQPSEKVSYADLELVGRFFSKSEQSMLETDANPFGDYGQQSGRIQGVLKSLYDTFAMDLEKDNVEEAESQKAYEEFMATKKAELKTLELTLEQQEAAMAAKVKEEAESKALRVDVQEQLKADEEFFATTKAGCEDKAIEWGERVRLRTEELQGIAKAIEILSDEENMAIFANSSAVAFLQIGSSGHKNQLVALQTLARKSGSKLLARIAEQARTGGYFDKVIASIDEMIALLRKEEKEDIEHRDRCQGAENDNKISKEELTNTIDRADKDIKRMEHEQKTTEQEVADVEVEIDKTGNDMEQALAMRNKEHKAFVKALEDDVKAKAILEKAKAALVEFYKRNDIPMLIQKKQPKEYTVDPDKAPETVWDAEGAEYKGRRDENEGVVAIITMIIEDVQKEVDDSRKDDDADQAAYEKSRAAMEETLKTQLASKAAMEKQLQELEQKIQDTTDVKDAKNADLEAEQELTKAIGSDCSWVTTHFQDRADKRKKELDGLVSAKDYLAGVATGTQLSP